MPLALLLLLGNIAASRPDPAKGGLSTSATKVIVTAEELTLGCDDALEPVCEVRAVYQLHNPEADVFDLEYAIAPLRTWGGMPKAIAVRVSAPSTWKLGSGDATGDGELSLSVDPQVTGVLHLRFTPPRQARAW